MRQYERRPKVVLRLLLHVLDEWELRRGEGRGDSRLVDEDKPESGSDNCLRSDFKCESYAWSHVSVMQFASAA